MKINFNEPFLSGNELKYIEDAVKRNHLSGNGFYSKKCQTFFEKNYNFKKCLLTTSCTDALEMCALLLNINEGDEVIMPSYTFVSTANAFALRGAKIVFVDSQSNHPNLDEKEVEKSITKNTKAIVVMHYGGVACNMKAIKKMADEHDLVLIEDAAQAINVKHHDKYLGGWGDLATFSFHETKNIQCGEGGMLVINNKKYIERAEIIWEKGTNRQQFFKGEVDKYKWVDLGSSFLPSELNAAYLFAQLEQVNEIQARRVELWNYYYKILLPLANDKKFSIVAKSSNENGHLFYISLKDIKQRDRFISYMKSKGVLTVFHYQTLHKSPYYLKNNKSISLPHSEYFEETLVRLPLFIELTEEKQKFIVNNIIQFFNYQ